jgi:hypothetical protein
MSADGVSPPSENYKEAVLILQSNLFCAEICHFHHINALSYAFDEALKREGKFSTY